jgi:glycolate dehydrogenase FAD-binding subunit
MREILTAGIHGLEGRAGTAVEPLWHALVVMTAPPEALVSFKANLMSDHVADLCRSADEFPEGLLVHAHAGSGIVRAHAPGGGLTVERAGAILRGLTEQAADARGFVVLPQCPPEWKRRLPVWGVSRGDAGLMKRVKEKMDPRRLFNPGRFVEGI